MKKTYLAPSLCVLGMAPFSIICDSNSGGQNNVTLEFGNTTEETITGENGSFFD